MRARGWLNLGLLIVVGSLAALAYFRPGKEGEQSLPQVTGTEKAEVDRIRFEPRKGESLTLVRKQGEWRLSEPRGLPANSGRVASLLGLLSLKSQATVEVEKNRLAELGLKEPEWTAEVGGHRFALGGDHPIKPQRYLRVDQTVHLVSRGAVRSVKSSWSAYASHQLLPAGARLTRLELPEVTLARGKDGGWKASDGASLKAKAAKETVKAWQERRAFALEAAEDGKGGPTAVLHLRDREEPVSYRVRSTDPQLELVRPDLGLLYRLPKGLVDTLIHPERSETEESEAGNSASVRNSGGKAPSAE